MLEVERAFWLYSASELSWYSNLKALGVQAALSWPQQLHTCFAGENDTFSAFME